MPIQHKKSRTISHPAFIIYFEIPFQVPCNDHSTLKTSISLVIQDFNCKLT
jgi:hypothetical protein